MNNCLLGIEQLIQLTGSVCMRNHTGQLRRHGYQKGFFTLVEATAILLLHHQHTEYFPVVNNGSTEERAETLLPRFGEKGKIGVSFSIFEIDRFGPRCHQTHQPLSTGQMNLAHRIWIEAIGSHQHIAIGTWTVEVDRTHAGIHNLFHQLNNQP